MAIRTKPKVQAAHASRSNRVRVKRIRRAPSLESHKPATLPAHRASHASEGREKSPEKSGEFSKVGSAPTNSKMGVPPLIELPDEATVTVGSAATGEVPRDLDVDLPNPRE